MNYVNSAKLILLLPVLALFSCQPAEAPPENKPSYADFFIRYLAAERQLKAYASFYEGDSLATAVSKAIPEGVAFQGGEMERRDLQNQMIRYTTSQTVDYAGRFVFTYSADRKGAPREHTVEMTPIDQFSLPDGISRSQGLTLEISGGPLLSNQSLVLLFSDTNNRAFSITVDGPTTTEVIVVTPDKLSSLPLGPGLLYLVKKQSIISRAQKLTTISEIEYYTHTQEVEVKE